MERIKRTGLTFAIVLVGYWTYALIAVPLIEPSVSISQGQEVAPESPQPRSFEGLFPPGSWELNDPKILETDQGTLLFDDFHPVVEEDPEADPVAAAERANESRTKLTRCSLICRLGGKQDGPEDRPIIVRAPRGAVLVFDDELDPTRGKIGRLMGGQLDGEITIYSPPSEPGCGSPRW